MTNHEEEFVCNIFRLVLRGDLVNASANLDAVPTHTMAELFSATRSLHYLIGGKFVTLAQAMEQNDQLVGGRRRLEIARALDESEDLTP